MNNFGLLTLKWTYSSLFHEKKIKTDSWLIGDMQKFVKK